MDSSEAGTFTSIVLAFLLFCAFAYGWVMNIINLIQGTYESTSTIVVGAIGCFIAPIGAITHFVAG